MLLDRGHYTSERDTCYWTGDTTLQRETLATRKGTLHYKERHLLLDRGNYTKEGHRQILGLRDTWDQGRKQKTKTKI